MKNHIRAASFIANLLDNQFQIFGRRFGLNGILGVIPGIGDIIPTLLSMHLIWIALKMKVPTAKIIQMLWNVIFNFLIGLLPVVGDYVDFFNHANLKNLAILEQFANGSVINGEIIDEKAEPPKLSYK
jgi:hypothetical protein